MIDAISGQQPVEIEIVPKNKTTESSKIQQTVLELLLQVNIEEQTKKDLRDLSETFTQKITSLETKGKEQVTLLYRIRTILLRALAAIGLVVATPVVGFVNGLLGGAYDVKKHFSNSWSWVFSPIRKLSEDDLKNLSALKQKQEAVSDRLSILTQEKLQEQKERLEALKKTLQETDALYSSEIEKIRKLMMLSLS